VKRETILRAGNKREITGYTQILPVHKGTHNEFKVKLLTYHDETLTRGPWCCIEWNTGQAAGYGDSRMQAMEAAVRKIADYCSTYKEWVENVKHHPILNKGPKVNPDLSVSRNP